MVADVIVQLGGAKLRIPFPFNLAPLQFALSVLCPGVSAAPCETSYGRVS